MRSLLHSSAQLLGLWVQEADILAAPRRYPGFEFTPRPPRVHLIASRETPGLLLNEETDCESPVKAWCGTIKPFASDVTDQELRFIIADLDADRDVGVLPNGTLAHLPGCRGPHNLRRALIPGRRLTERYTIEIACRIPLGLPFVRAIDPLICPEATVLTADGESIVPEPFRPPHLQWREGVLCITLPSDRQWEFGKGMVADFLDQTALWLAKHTIWSECRERLGTGEGIWIGKATRHDELAIFQMLAEVRPDGPCQCGSARPYARCCQPRNGFHAAMLFLAMARDEHACDPWIEATHHFKPQYREVAGRAMKIDRASVDTQNRPVVNT